MPYLSGVRWGRARGRSTGGIPMMMRIRRCGIIYTHAEGIALTVETRLLLSFPVPPTEVGLLFFVLEKGAERPLVSFLFPPLALNRIGDGGPPPNFCVSSFP